MEKIISFLVNAHQSDIHKSASQQSFVIDSSSVFISEMY